MTLHLTYSQKQEIDALIIKGESEEAVRVTKKHALVNEREAKEYVVRRERYMTKQDDPDTSENEY